MIGLRKKYDFIASLGGNCAVAQNLRLRNKRPFSLPFDWVYMEDEKPILYLVEGFKNRFSNLALKENLKQLPGTKDHAIIYQDTYSKYCFPNHFPCTLSEKDTYKTFSQKLARRVNRFLEHIDRSNAILFLLSLDKKIDYTPLQTLHHELQILYPNKIFDIAALMFDAQEEQLFHQDEHIWIHYISRPMNNYDFTNTNYEWAFLDTVDWNGNYATDKSSRQLCSIHLGKYYKLKLLLKREPRS